MILVLNGADFSANNIGTIDIPVKPTEQQKTILSAYSKSITEQQQNAFIKFHNTLTNSGVMDKITALYLPVMAGQLSEVFFNVKDLSDASANLDSESLTRLTEENFALDNMGITQLVAAKALYLTTFTDIKANNFHYLVYNSDDTKAYHGLDLFQEWTVPINIASDNSADNWCHLQQSSINNVNLSTACGVSFVAYLTHGISYEKSLQGYGGDTQGFALYASPAADNLSNKMNKYNYLEGYSDSFNVNFVKTSITYINQIRLAKPVPLFSLGAYLTENDYTIFADAANEFISAF